MTSAATERRRLERERIRRGQAHYAIWVPNRAALCELLVDAEFLHRDHVGDKAAETRALELYVACMCRA